MSFFAKIGQSIEKAANKVRGQNAAAARAILGVVEPLYNQTVKPIITAPGKVITSATNLVDAVSKAGSGIVNSAATATNALANRTGAITDQITSSAGTLVNKASDIPTLAVVGVIILAGLVVAPILFRPDATSAAIGNTAAAVRTVASRGMF